MASTCKFSVFISMYAELNPSFISVCTFVHVYKRSNKLKKRITSDLRVYKEHFCHQRQTRLSSGWRNWPVTSSEQPSQDPQPGRAGSGGWCAGGLCSRRGRTVSGPAGCGGAAQDEEEEEEEWLGELCQCWHCDRSVLCSISYVVCEWKWHNSISFPEVAINCTSRLIL